MVTGLNILVVNWRCIKNPEAGGAETHLHEIFSRVVRKGHNVTLVAHKFRNSASEELFEGINIKRIGSKYDFKWTFKRYYQNELCKMPFDLVVDDISKIPLFTPRYINKPLVGIIHHFHGESLYKEVPFPVAYYISGQERKIPEIYKNVPIFVVSPSTAEELIRLGHPQNKTAFLYNAIRHELFSGSGFKKSQNPLIVYVGRIKKYKNIELIIDAFLELKKTFNNLNLQIGGTGSHLSHLMNYCQNKGLNPGQIFTGFLTEEGKARLLSEAWVFATMAEKEGWGITVIEANAAGTPVVGSRVAGLKDSIRDNETGFLTEPGNVNALAEKLRRILSDEEIRIRLSQNARNWAAEFNWDNTTDEFMRKVGEWYPGLSKNLTAYL